MAASTSPGRHGPAEISIALDSSQGGSTQALQAFVRSGLEFGSNAETAEVTGFGDSYRKHSPTGLANVDDIDLTVIFDDTATTGTFAVLGTVDTAVGTATRTFQITLSAAETGADTWTVECLLVSSKIVLSLDDIQMMNVTLRPTGAPAFA